LIAILVIVKVLVNLLLVYLAVFNPTQLPVAVRLIVFGAGLAGLCASWVEYKQRQ
jgi:hypothetical protein